MSSARQMPLVETLQALRSVRTDEAVITVMGTAREWVELGCGPLDFVYVPSSMGQGPAIGLGVALAQPDRKVVVCNGDGCMLMNLGSLVTISGQPAENLVLLIFDNGIYEVTGGQQTPGSAAARDNGHDVDFTGMARACGFRSVFEFDDLARWQANVRNVLDARGPTVAVLRVAPRSISVNMACNRWNPDGFPPARSSPLAGRSCVRPAAVVRCGSAFSPISLSPSGLLKAAWVRVRVRLNSGRQLSSQAGYCLKSAVWMKK